MAHVLQHEELIGRRGYGAERTRDPTVEVSERLVGSAKHVVNGSRWVWE
jgi:hypothetical protein